MKHLALAFLLLALITSRASAEEPELNAAISLDIPPYVMDGATKGLEVDIVRGALTDQSIRFVQMPYGDLETAIPKGLASISIGVQETDDEVFYSDDFIAFENYAISKKRDNLKIEDIDDLGDYQVLTWQGAYLELGDAFKELFAPDSPKHANYVEIPDQKEQVRRFWKTEDTVAVIDRSIFNYFSEAMGHSMSEVQLHKFFKPVTDFKVGFKDSALRDTFNGRLAEMCRSGEYDALLEQYNVILRESVCDKE